MELTEQIDGATHEVHGIRFKRIGSCNQCGACNCEKFNCPHFSWQKVKGKNLATCSIQNTKNDVCAVCTNDPSSGFYNEGKPVTHKMCAEFPDHPWLHVIKEGKCGYSFTPTDETNESKFSELSDKWQ